MDYVKELQKVQPKQTVLQPRAAVGGPQALPAAKLDFSDLPTMPANPSASQQYNSPSIDDSSSAHMPHITRKGHSQMRLILIALALLIAVLCLRFAFSFAAIAWDGYTLHPLPVACAFAFTWLVVALPLWAFGRFMRRHTHESLFQHLVHAGGAIAVTALIVGLGLGARALAPQGIDVGHWLGNEPRQAAANTQVATDVVTEASLDATTPAAVVVASGAIDAAKPASSRRPVDTTDKKYSDPDLLKVSAGDRSPNEANTQGQTAVHIAAQQNDSKTLHKLLLLGGRGDIGDHQGHTALHLAVRHSPQILPQLLQAMTAGAQLLDQRDAQGQTALMLAAIKGNSRAIDLLVITGASTHLKNQENLTAQQLAQRHGHNDIATQLTR